MVFTFLIYIRIILQSFELMAISTVYEIYNYDVSNALNISSLVISCIMIILSFAYIFGIFVFVKHSLGMNFEKSNSYCKELINGLKETKKARLYYSFFTLRRLISVILLIAGQEMWYGLKLVVFVIIHFGVMVYIISVRPFAKVKGNIIEIINEIWYSILISFLFFFHK